MSATSSSESIRLDRAESHERVRHRPATEGRPPPEIDLTASFYGLGCAAGDDRAAKKPRQATLWRATAGDRPSFRYYRFDGGCVTYRFDLTGSGLAAFTSGAELTTGFYSRAALEQLVRRTTGLDL